MQNEIEDTQPNEPMSDKTTQSVEGGAEYDRLVNDRDQLAALLVQGLDSGDPIPLDANEWSRIREDVARRLSNT